MSNKYLILFVILFVISSCKNQAPKQNKVEHDNNLIEISSPNENEVIEIYQRFPSVDELLPSLIKKDFQFNAELPVGMSYVITTDDVFTKKMLLGFYFADIGYYNIFQKKTESLGCLKSFVDLCENLQVSVKFDRGILQLMEHNSYGIDSIKHLSAKNYFMLLQSFKSEGDVSTLKAFTGGMLIEILYLSLNSITNDSQFENYMDLIAEQKSLIEHYLVYVNRLGSVDEISFREKDIKHLYLMLAKFDVEMEDVHDTIKMLQQEKLIYSEEVFYAYKNELNLIRNRYLE